MNVLFFEIECQLELQKKEELRKGCGSKLPHSHGRPKFGLTVTSAELPCSSTQPQRLQIYAVETRAPPSPEGAIVSLCSIAHLSRVPTAHASSTRVGVPTSLSVNHRAWNSKPKRSAAKKKLPRCVQNAGQTFCAACVCCSCDGTVPLRLARLASPRTRARAHCAIFRKYAVGGE